MTIKPKANLFLLLVVLICSRLTVRSQATDSLVLLAYDDFIQQVLQNHPAAKQAQLLERQSQAILLEARGGFDPYLFSEFQQKSFDGKNYYTTSESGLKIPTWYGLTAKGAYQTARGVYLNPENRLPEDGQAILGINASLLRGMFIDDRRAALQQARLTARLNAAERTSRLNDLAFEATTAYWSWAAAYNEKLVLEKTLTLARVRLENLVESFRQGDKPAIDTLEAFIAVQNRQLELQDANLAFQNAIVQVRQLLWTNDSTESGTSFPYRPYQLLELPGTSPLPPLAIYLESLQQHPELVAYLVKSAQLDVEKRLVAEGLKPQLDVEYNLLGNGARFGDAGIGNLLLENYKWGLQFSFPVLLRKTRGKLESIRVKILDTDYSIQQKKRALSAKLESYYNEAQNTLQQAARYQAMTDNYRNLLTAEQRKFELGESAVFLLNTREQKLLETELKLAKLRCSAPKAMAAVAWAAGILAK